MKATLRQMLKKNSGNALLITLVILMVTVTLVEIVMSQTSRVAKNTERSRQYQGAEAAASGAIEYAYGVWLRSIANKHDLLSSAADLAVSSPSFSGTGNAPAGTFGFIYNSGTSPLAASGSLTIRALDKYGKVLPLGSAPDPVISTVPKYPGWWGRTYSYAATAEMRPNNGDPNAPVARVRQLFYYTEVPLFQCMYFFQHDLEIINPATMTLNGLIHTNGRLYLAAQSGSLTINGPSTFVNSYTSTKTTMSGSSNTALGSSFSFYGYSASSQTDPTFASTPSQVTSISAMGADMQDLFSGSGASTNPNLSGTYHELIELPVSGSDPLSDRRLCNIAANTNSQTGDTGGIIIDITGAALAGSTTRITTLPTSQLPASGATMTGTTMLISLGTGASIATTSNSTAFINALVTSATAAISKKLATSGSSVLSGSSHLYDSREGTLVNVVDIDVAKLQAAIASYVTGFSNIIYICDTSSNGKLNVIRLLNGSTISGSDGLTIASLNPVYVQGDFNTGGTGNSVPSNLANSSGSISAVTNYATPPTSIVADAITLLSNNWADAKSVTSSTVGSGLSARIANDTTYNVALLGGYITSSGTAWASGSNYSGGAINYPRFLEDWSSQYCTYHGSMVELFPSKSITKWSTGTYYSPPVRHFFFDTQFSSKSPPGSVNAVILSRGIWSRY